MRQPWLADFNQMQCLAAGEGRSASPVHISPIGPSQDIIPATPITVSSVSGREHLIESVRVGDGSQQLCVSTVGDLKIKGATAGHGSLQFIGSIATENLQDITQLSRELHASRTGEVEGESAGQRGCGEACQNVVRCVVPPVMLAAEEFQDPRFNRAKYQQFPRANLTIPPSTTCIPPGQARYAMADPLSIASSVVALVTFALQSSAVLYTTVRSFQSQDKDVRALKGELGDLTSVLESLLDTVTSHPNLEFDALKIPLHRCGKACQEYGALIERCSKHSTESRPSIRDWITQKYLQGDIDDFRAMLAGYKSTINIALANANMCAAPVSWVLHSTYANSDRIAASRPSHPECWKIIET